MDNFGITLRFKIRSLHFDMNWEIVSLPTINQISMLFFTYNRDAFPTLIIRMGIHTPDDFKRTTKWKLMPIKFNLDEFVNQRPLDKVE